VLARLGAISGLRKLLINEVRFLKAAPQGCWRGGRLLRRELFALLSRIPW
jgi:hypothetical protein